MKKPLFLAVVAAVLLWLVFAAVLLGMYRPAWLPNAFSTLTIPTSLSDFGQAFSAFEGIISSFALMLGLIAVLIQVKQNTDSNVIGATSARQQFLLAEYNRLDNQIADHIAKNTGKPTYDKNLISNMSNKRAERLADLKKVDEDLKKLLCKM